MKKKDLQNKELGELEKMLNETMEKLPKVSLEHHLRRNKNVKEATNLRRHVAVLSGMISNRRTK